MRRYPELIRKLLLFFENKENLEIVQTGSLEIDGFDNKAIEYHLMLMAQADLIKRFEASRLTIV